MSYDKQEGLTNQGQKGGQFNGIGGVAGVTNQKQDGGVFSGNNQSVYGVTSQNQDGGVFSGVYQLPGNQGEPGAQGPKGDTGATGAQGPAGAQGPQGNPGVPGTDGKSVTAVQVNKPTSNTAQLVETLSDGSTITSNSFTLPSGTAGATITSVTVNQPTNVLATITEQLSDGTSVTSNQFTLPLGPQGNQGPQGNPGPQGAPGPQGQPGPTGATGVGISTITATQGTATTTNLPVTFTEVLTNSTQLQQTVNIPLSNQVLYGTAIPDGTVVPTTYPALYIRTTTPNYVVYGRVTAASGWSEIDNDVTTIDSPNGTITVTQTISATGKDISLSIAQQGATDGQVLTWDTATSKWLPRTVVAGVTVEDEGLVIGTGVPILNFSGDGVSVVGGNTGVTINIPGGSAVSYPTLTEPSWRTVNGSGTSALIVSDNAQNPVSVFAGTATPQYLFVVPTDIGSAVANVSTITMNSVNIDGVFTTQTYTATNNQTAYDARTTFLYLRSPPANRFWFNEVGETGTQDFWSLFNNAGVTNGFFIQYTRASNGTRNPVHTNSALTFTFSGFTGQGATPRVVTATLNQSQGPNTDAPVWRNLNTSDIEPLFTNYPANGQVASWSNNRLDWVTPTDSTTTLTQGNGISISDAGVGINHAYTVSASLSAQDNGAAISGNYYNINLGSNLSGSISNGILTINASGGGGGASIMAASSWSSGGTTKQAYNNATGPSQGTLNSQGVTLTFTASTNVGQVTNATVSFNGTAATGTYSSTGTFPTYTMTIPAGSIPVAAQSASVVAISINATYDTVQTLIDGGSLTNTQPQAASPSLSATGQTLTARAFYSPQGTGTITASTTTAVGTISAVNYTLDSGTAQASGTFTGVSVGSHNISSSGTASGVRGAGLNIPFGPLTTTASITQAVYTPAFYQQSSSSTIPSFTTSTTQTSGDAQGSTIVYPVATATTQYNFIATTRPLSALALRTPFGDQTLVPDVTSTQTISGTVFNIYGWTSLVVGKASVLIIS